LIFILGCISWKIIKRHGRDIVCNNDILGLKMPIKLRITVEQETVTETRHNPAISDLAAGFWCHELIFL